MVPLVSIVMPVYNCEKFIEESIKSIREQTYTNWELIIINDGSQDNTKDILLQIQDPRIHIINLDEHYGLTAAFSKGYESVKGDYIVRHDGDDISAPDRLELQVDYLENNPRVGMVSSLISCFTRDPLFRKDCNFIERIQNHYVEYDEIKKAALGGFIPILFPTLMIRKAAMDKVNLDNKNLSFDDHLEVLLELMQITPVEKINSILYYYRRHKDAYHVTNQKLYEHYCSNLLNDPVVKNHIKFRDFYKNLIIPAETKTAINEDSSIRVLMLIDALNVGGTETHVLSITKKLIDIGIYVVVATSGGPLEGVLDSYGVKIIKIPISNDYISNKEKNGLIKMLKKIVDDEKITIIHCHLFASMQLASELYRMYKLPYIVTIHGLFYPNDVLYSSCIEAEHIIAVSEPVKKMLLEKLGNRIQDKVVVLPNGISTDIVKDSDIETDIKAELNIPESSQILCYCSRLDWNKTEAARVFLFAFSQLIGEFQDVHAIIIGDGSGRESIEKEAQIINEMANKKIVHVIGAKVNVISYYLKSTVIIGTARVALEAMMCKKPVIALGNHGYSGIIAPANKFRQWKMYFGDHDSLSKPNVSKLASDIRLLLSDPDACKRLGSWGYQWCKNIFNIDKIVDRIVQLYKRD